MNSSANVSLTIESFEISLNSVSAMKNMKMKTMLFGWTALKEMKRY